MSIKESLWNEHLADSPLCNLLILLTIWFFIMFFVKRVHFCPSLLAFRIRYCHFNWKFHDITSLPYVCMLSQSRDNILTRYIWALLYTMHYVYSRFCLRLDANTLHFVGLKDYHVLLKHGIVSKPNLSIWICSWFGLYMSHGSSSCIMGKRSVSCWATSL